MSHCLLKAPRHSAVFPWICRDIKASNILLDSDGTVCIADFGVAGWMDDITSREGKREVIGSLGFADEILTLAQPVRVFVWLGERM